MERLDIEGLTFHKECFRCTKCDCKLGNEFSKTQKGNFYCKVHYNQLFMLRGRFSLMDEGQLTLSKFDSEGVANLKPKSHAEEPQDSGESTADSDELQRRAETETTDGEWVDAQEPKTKETTVAANTEEPQMIVEPAEADSLDAQEMNTAAARRLYACLLAQMSFEVS
jgi:hypothetical protein